MVILRAPQIVPARIVWRTELGQQLPGEREARRRAGAAAERGDLDRRGVAQGQLLAHHPGGVGDRAHSIKLPLGGNVL